MAPKKGPKKVVEKLSLTAVALAANDQPGYLFTFPDEHAELLAAGYVQVNPELKDENGAIATAITEAGIAYLNSQAGTSAEENTMFEGIPAAAGFEIEEGFDIPESRRTGKANIYPFDALTAPVYSEGQKPRYASFFVPATADRPDPVKTLASTVSSANVRYSEPDQTGATRMVNRGPNKGQMVLKTISTRKFVIKEGVDKAGNKGARIFRTV